jgi:hypothetical protein
MVCSRPRNPTLPNAALKPTAKVPTAIKGLNSPPVSGGANSATSSEALYVCQLIWGTVSQPSRRAPLFIYPRRTRLAHLQVRKKKKSNLCASTDETLSAVPVQGTSSYIPTEDPFGPPPGMSANQADLSFALSPITSPHPPHSPDSPTGPQDHRPSDSRPPHFQGGREFFIAKSPEMAHV